MNALLKIIKTQYQIDGNNSKLEQHYKLAQAAMRINERFRNSFQNERDKLRSLRTTNQIVSQCDVELFPIHHNKQEINEKTKLFRALLNIDSITSFSREQVFQQYTQTAHWFYKEILSPALDGKKYDNLIIITDGELGHLPFEAFLVEPVSLDGKDYHNLHYLINDHNISYNYSATLWKENLRTAPSFGSEGMLACASIYPVVDTCLKELRLPHYYRLRNTLDPLYSAKQELSSLAGQFKGTFLSGTTANEKFFKVNAHRYSIIHLAMHGIWDKRTPILSSLAFTEDNDSSENNFLQAYEISRMQLKAALVVLSACETGYGIFEQGEGIMSLARAFMYAGVPSLVVSLWKADDEATATIMASFYDNLADGMDKASALRLAKLEYIKNTEGLKGHPAFWSAFIQLGDSRGVALERKMSWGWWVTGGLGALAIVLLLLQKVLAKSKQNLNRAA